MNTAKTPEELSVVQRPTHVVGLLFSSDASRVVLIRKARPAWQVGFLNGVGGKVEEGEAPAAAMAREFREETGYAGAIDWRWFCRYDCPSHGTLLDFFCAADDVAYEVARTVDESEPIVKVDLATADRGINVIPNLVWIIPMACNLLSGRSQDRFAVAERADLDGPAPGVLDAAIGRIAVEVRSRSGVHGATHVPVRLDDLRAVVDALLRDLFREVPRQLDRAGVPRDCEPR